MLRRHMTWWGSATAATAATALLVGGAGLTGSAFSAVAAEPGCADVRVAAHRGNPSPGITENTLESFERARNAGARWIEADLRLTSDGAWVLMHDGTVDRTTRGTGRVAAHTLSWLKALRTNGGQEVPTFSELVADQPATIGYQLEIKVPGANNAQLQRVVDRLRDKSSADLVFLTSTHREVLQRLSVLAPEFQRGLVVSGNTPPSPADIPAYVDSVNVLHKVATASFITRMHDNAKQVQARNANSQDRWNALVAADVDRMVTDDIAGHTTWCYGSPA